MFKRYVYKLAFATIFLCVITGTISILWSTGNSGILEQSITNNVSLIERHGKILSGFWDGLHMYMGMGENSSLNVSDKPKAQVAIVIDDFGQSNKEGIKEMMSINKPLTFAVMPNLENTYSEAVQAKEKGYEIIVHLPMQPLNGKSSWMGPGGITPDMKPNEIREKVVQDFAQVPHAVGFNNHMGSSITSKEELMRPILEVAKEKGLFVLDSRTSENSKVISLAQSMGIPCAKRDVFLDEVKSSEHMKKQLKLLAKEALAKGSAISIGHVGQGGKKMAQAISEMIPVMEAQGIEFVYLSKLVH